MYKKAVGGYLEDYIKVWSEIREKTLFLLEDSKILARNSKDITETILSRLSLLSNAIIKEAKRVGEEIGDLAKTTTKYSTGGGPSNRKNFVSKGDSLAKRAEECISRLGKKRRKK